MIEQVAYDALERTEEYKGKMEAMQKETDALRTELKLMRETVDERTVLLQAHLEKARKPRYRIRGALCDGCIVGGRSRRQD